MGAQYKISAQVAWRIVDGQVFAVTQDGRIHNIDDATGLCVWDRLNKSGATFEQLLTAVTDEFAVEQTVAQGDLDEFLSSLSDLGLVETG